MSTHGATRNLKCIPVNVFILHFTTFHTYYSASMCVFVLTVIYPSRCYRCKSKVKTRNDISPLKKQLEIRYKILKLDWYVLAQWCIHNVCTHVHYYLLSVYVHTYACMPCTYFLCPCIFSDVVMHFEVPPHPMQRNICWVCQKKFGIIFNRAVKCHVCLRNYCKQHAPDYMCDLCKSIEYVTAYLNGCMCIIFINMCTRLVYLLCMYLDIICTQILKFNFVL